jgi:hypothetical protein
MTILWTTTLFPTYLIWFQLKYLKGDIFENTYYYAISDIISRIFGGIIYSEFGMKRSIIVSQTISLIGGAAIYFI